MPHHIMLIALLAAVAAGGIVLLIRMTSRRIRLIDHPNGRSMHEMPTPRGGGAGIVIVTLCGLAYTAGETPALGVYLVPAALVALVSFIDDFRSLPATLRLGVHAGCAFLVLRGATFEIGGPLAMVLAILWIGGLANAYNFMDGIDGLAGTQAIVTGLAVAWLGSHASSSLLVTLGLLIAGSAAGFLVHNWSPARIFMGDVGSVFLGFTFAAVPLLAPDQLQALLLVAAATWPFLFDTSFTMLRRLLRGENIFHSHRSHLYQRLVLSGWSHARVTMLYATLAAGGAIAAAVDRHLAIAIVPAAAALWLLVVQSETAAARQAVS